MLNMKKLSFQPPKVGSNLLVFENISASTITRQQRHNRIYSIAATIVYNLFDCMNRACFLSYIYPLR